MQMKCHYCEKHMTKPTKDHIVPRAKRGRDAEWNIVLSCQPCNQAKGDSWPTCECTKCRASVTIHRMKYRVGPHSRRVKRPKSFEERFEQDTQRLAGKHHASRSIVPEIDDHMQQKSVL